MSTHRHSPAKREKLRKRRALRREVAELRATVQALEARPPQLIILTEAAAAELLKGSTG